MSAQSQTAGVETARRAAPGLALFGGTPAVTRSPGDLFTWPIITKEDEKAVLDVLWRREMSGTAITMAFEEEFAAWMGVKYALGVHNGTASILAALFGVGVGTGDEIICPAITFWASALPVFALGGTVVFADIDPLTLCIDPADIERHVSPRTKAIVVVHYLGHPADMDPIISIARKHGLKIVEDVSHAQGALYKGRKVGSFGDVAAYSLMTAKALAIGEAGMLTTNDREIYERAVAFGHYERFNAAAFQSEALKPVAGPATGTAGMVATDDREAHERTVAFGHYERFNAAAFQSEALKPFAGLPLGGAKHRMHQMSSAVGRVQLRHYDQRCVEIRKAMNHFWDLLEDVPGLRAHRVDEKTGNTMGGWYCPHGIYRGGELGGLSITRFCAAVRAEGVTDAYPGCNKPLHTHPLLNEGDFYRLGKPTRIAHSDRDLRQPAGSLPVAEEINRQVYFIPWFKHYRPRLIAEYAAAYRKVAMNASLLLAEDPGDPPDLGGWAFFKARK